MKSTHRIVDIDAASLEQIFYDRGEDDTGPAQKEPYDEHSRRAGVQLVRSPSVP